MNILEFRKDILARGMEARGLVLAGVPALSTEAWHLLIKALSDKNSLLRLGVADRMAEIFCDLEHVGYTDETRQRVASYSATATTAGNILETALQQENSPFSLTRDDVSIFRDRKSVV